MKTTILNTSILTNYGSYNYEPLTFKQTRELVQEIEQIGYSFGKLTRTE